MGVELSILQVCRHSPHNFIDFTTFMNVRIFSNLIPQSIVLSACLLAVPDVWAEKSLLKKASLCAQILDINIRNEEEPDLLPYVVEVKSTKNLSGSPDPLFEPVHISKFRLHSPARMFAVSEDQLKNMNFELSLTQSNAGWMLTGASRDSVRCK